MKKIQNQKTQNSNFEKDYYEVENHEESRNSSYANYLIEFLGTMFLVLTIALSVKTAWALAPFAIASVLSLLVYAGGHISWANYNPAVSLWLFLSGKLNKNSVVPYMISQVLWAFVWALVGKIILWNWFSTLVVAPTAWVDVVRWVLAEFLFTFLLVFVVLQVATSKKVTWNQFFWLAIWLVVLVWALSVWGISGWAFNPAVALWPQLLDTMLWGHSINNILGYLLAGFGWAALASSVFNYTEKNMD